MRTLFLLFFSAALLLGLPRHADAQEPARAIIEKAVKALGGEEKLSRSVASHTRIKGSVAELNDAHFTGDNWVQKPDVFKTVLTVEVAGNRITMVQALVGNKGWMSQDGAVQDLDAGMVADMKQSAYHDRVVSLFPLLRDKGFTLKALGPSKVDGKDALGVRVSSPGQADVHLFFDGATGLLLKTEWRAKKEVVGKEVTTAIRFSDYREIDPAAPEERVLREAKIGADGASLLAFLRSQVRSPVDRTKVKVLIKQLADEDFQLRKKAADDLVQIGAVAIPQLREATRDDDAEVARRARECLAKIEETKKADGALGSALRVVGWRKPEGTAEVLLALAPSLTEEALARDLRGALAEVAIRDGKPEKLVEKALEDKDPARRAAAAAALGRDGGAFARTSGRRLFLTGIKRATKMIYYQDGAKQLDYEVVEISYYNKLDEQLFAKPR